MKTYTPGPWTFTTGFVNIYDTSSRVVASLDSEASPDIEYSETVANARLIAAAPDLLIALETIMACVAGCERDEKYQAARAAIAKAGGAA